MKMFDRIDASILRALQREGRLSQNDLGEMVGASPASCWRRVKALEASGVLGPIVRLVHQPAVGLVVNVLCHIRLRNHLPETSLAFEAFVDSVPSIVACFSVSGDWDYLLRVVATDIASYERMLRMDILANPTVATASSTFAMSTLKHTTELPIQG